LTEIAGHEHDGPKMTGREIAGEKVQF